MFRRRYVIEVYNMAKVSVSVCMYLYVRLYTLCASPHMRKLVIRWNPEKSRLSGVTQRAIVSKPIRALRFLSAAQDYR